jgi:zinc protease
MPDRKSPPQTSIITHVPFIPPKKMTLDNQVPVYFLKGGTEEILKIEWVFHAGSYYQPKPLVTFAMTNLLKAGTNNKTAAEISEILDFYGAYLQLDAQKDIVSVSVFVLNKNLEPVLDLLQEVVRTPTFPEDECELLLRNQKQQYVINNRKVQHLARTHFSELLFGERHPYGLRPEEEDFGRVDREDLLNFHRQWVHGGNGLCIVSGKIPDGLPALLNARFGDQDWIGRTNRESFRELSLMPSEKKSLLISREDALQSAIRIGKLVISRNHPDYHRLMITNALLGGFFGSRLMRNIRQEKGFTYGINSSIVSLMREGYFFIGT